MTNGTLRVRSMQRGAIPVDAHPGEALVAWLQRVLSEGAHAPAGLVVRAGALDLVDLSTAKGSGLPVPWLMAGLTTTVTRAGPAVAVGLLGVVGRAVRDAERPAPMAVVFLEWEDNRWWFYEALLAADGRSLREDTVTVRSAEAGDAMPQGLGRWWAAARRSGMRMNLEVESGAEEEILH